MQHGGVDADLQPGVLDGGVDSYTSDTEVISGSLIYSDALSGIFAAEMFVKHITLILDF